MKTANIAALLTSLLMFVSLTSHATIITASGKSFDNLGSSTVDMTTKLEWRDFDLSNGRAYCSVALDTGSAVPAVCTTFDNKDLIANAEGWRYASSAEVAGLLSDWFGIAAPGQYSSTTVNAALSTEFRAVFANTTGSIRPDYLQYASYGLQSLGLYVAGTNVSMDMANGSINDNCCGQGAMLVRNSTAAATVPEPAPLALLALSFAGLALLRRRRN
ncbi:PEP-CTERM sorting domain-containing protein [Massilia sp. PWRC2]|uniref:PEP-CTERM sorting domain-containing protein n=1 Tax=Massilia sp. PWRC2 TaxID=2804626 RepID=UPI003CEE5D13